jgi:hypothetical protein
VIHRNTSRWERSEVTFGPAGRVCVTILLFVPVWFGIFFNVFFLVAAAIWMFVLPMALHQVWQPVRIGDETAWPVIGPSAAQPVIGPSAAQPVIPAEPAEPAPGESLMERSAPARW